MRRERRERFPCHRRLATPTCITPREWRTYNDACRDRYPTFSFEVGRGKNVPGIPGACATRNFTHLVRGLCKRDGTKVSYLYYHNDALVFCYGKIIFIELCLGALVFRSISYAWNTNHIGKLIKSYNHYQTICYFARTTEKYTYVGHIVYVHLIDKI